MTKTPDEQLVVHLDKVGSRIPLSYCPWCHHLIDEVTMKKRSRPDSVAVCVCVYCCEPAVIEGYVMRKPKPGELPPHVFDAISVMAKHIKQSRVNTGQE